MSGFQDLAGKTIFVSTDGRLTYWLWLKETYGPSTRLDLPGLALASTGLFGIVWGVVRGNAQGWASPEILASLGLGTILTIAFVLWVARLRAAPLGTYPSSLTAWITRSRISGYVTSASRMSGAPFE